jgi:hypothetical protein
MFLKGGIMSKLFLLALVLPSLVLAIYDMEYFDLNHWRAPFYNYGLWGTDTTGIGAAGGTWPQPLHNCYFFGAGTWLGAVAPGGSPGETLCTVFYNPNSGWTEACPALCRYWRQGYRDSLDRIYKYPGDWPPPLSRFPLAPQVPISDMDLWCCFSDSDPANHILPGRPLGVDVYLTACGFDDSLAQDFLFLGYEIANCSGDSLRRAYFGPCVDPDIGDAADDVTGLILDTVFVVRGESIRVENVGLVFDYDNYEPPSPHWDSGAPGALLFMLLAAPDSLGVTALKRFSIDVDPITDRDQYLTMAGYDYRTGEYAPYDTSYDGPGDVRMVLSSGPFDLAPNETATWWYAIIGTPYGDTGTGFAARDPSELALRCKWARDYYNRRIAGVAEGKSNADVRTASGGTTIFHNVLSLPVSPSTIPTSLFDMTGRRVMPLRPGANDVRSLSPGVYFVREAQTQAVRKIVITR